MSKAWKFGLIVTKVDFMDVDGIFASLCASLIGLPISHIWRGHGSAVFLEIGTLTPTVRKDGSKGNPKGEVGLGVEWNWRIEADSSIICGSCSDETLWQSAFERLTSSPIARCEPFGTIPELVISTYEAFRFLSFSTTDGQPQWFMIDRRGANVKVFDVQKGKLHLS